jgi:hypothetical protein
MQFVKTAVFLGVFIALFLQVPANTHAQTQAIAVYTVGTGTAPALDGKWHESDWDDAVELQVQYSLGDPLPPAYIRLKHDTAWLYFIYDVPFDTTQDQALAQAPQLPTIVLEFDGNAEPFSQYNLNDCRLTGQVTSTGTTGVGYGRSNVTSYQPYLVQYLHSINITQSLGPSPHSDTPHRIWEGRIPLYPLIMNAPKAPDFSPVIGFNTEVQDALGNAVQLQPLTQTYSIIFLKIAAYPVPENLNLITPFFLTLIVLTVYAVMRSRRRIPGPSLDSR